MTTTDAYLAARPRLRSEIILGPALTEGTGVIHHLKDPRTGWYFRIGAREFFVISRMDGSRTLAEIGDEYVRAFGRRLGDQHWQQILAMLGGRRLLDGMADDESVAQLADAAKLRSKDRQGLLLYRRSLINPDRLFGSLEPRLRILFSPFVVIPALIAVVGLLVGLIVRLGTIYADARHGMRDGFVLVAAVVIVWLSLALHEAAHGMTCKHFGGTATEIGIIWRFPILAPYCKADDVVLFPRRRHRVYTSFAGIFVGLIVLIPFAILWAVSPKGSNESALSAVVLLFGASAALFNLVPFLQLDGYFMLNHALGMVNLRTESYRFWSRLTGRMIRRGPGISKYPVWARWAFGIYGVASLIYGLSLGIRIISVWFGMIHRWVGLTGTVILLVGMAALAVSSAALRSRRRRGRQTDPPSRALGGAVLPATGGMSSIGSVGGGQS